MKKIFSLAIVASALACQKYRLPDGVPVIENSQTKRIFEQMRPDQMQGLVRLCENPKIVDLLTNNAEGLLNLILNFPDLLKRTAAGPLFTEEEVAQIRGRLNIMTDVQMTQLRDRLTIVSNAELAEVGRRVNLMNDSEWLRAQALFRSGNFAGPLVVNGKITCNELQVNGPSSFGGALTVAPGHLATFGGGIDVTGIGVFGTLRTTGLASLESLGVTNGSTLNTLSTTGLATLYSLTVDNGVDLNSTLAVSGETTLRNKLTIEASGLEVTGDVVFADKMKVSGVSNFEGRIDSRNAVIFHNHAPVFKKGLTVYENQPTILGGALSVAGATTFTGLTTHNGGLTVANGQATTLDGALAVTGDTTLVGLTASGATQINNTFTVGAHATTLGGNLGVTGATTFTGPTTHNAGLTVANGQTTTLSGTLAVTGATTFTGLTTHNAGIQIANAQNLTMGTAGNNAGNFIQYGTGTFTTGTGAVTIGGATTFTGLTTHNSGVTLGQNKNFTMQGASARIINNQGVRFGSNVEIEGVYNFTTGTGQVTLGKDVLINRNLNVTGAGNIGNLHFDQINPTGGNLTINGNLAVTGATTFTGLTTHNSGVTLGNDQHFTMSGNGAIKNAAGSVRFGNDVNLLSNNFTMGNGNFTTGTGDIALNGDVTLGNGKNLTLQGTGAFTTGTGDVKLNGGVTIANGKNLTMGTDATSTGVFLQNGSGTFTVGDGAVTIGGPTTFNGVTNHKSGAEIMNSLIVKSGMNNLLAVQGGISPSFSIGSNASRVNFDAFITNALKVKVSTWKHKPPVTGIIGGLGAKPATLEYMDHETLLLPALGGFQAV